MTDWNNNIKKAPFQQVIWVKNDVMEKPVMATRGYMTELGMHPDDTFFTSVFTPNDKFFPMPDGLLVCPNKWHPLDSEDTP